MAVDAQCEADVVMAFCGFVACAHDYIAYIHVYVTTYLLTGVCDDVTDNVIGHRCDYGIPVGWRCICLFGSLVSRLRGQRRQ